MKKIYTKYGIVFGIIVLISCNDNTSVHIPEKIEKLYPFEDHFLQKQYPGNNFAINAYFRAMDKARAFSKNISNRTNGSWVVQGPGNIGARANTIAVDPKNPSNMFIGFSDGGLFRTKNSGKDWDAIFDNQLSLSIGDVIIDPFDSKTIYVGTGDPNVSGFPFVGNGIFKSTDGGDTWIASGLEQTRIISQLRVSTQNRNILYAGTMGLPFEKNNHRGLYKSTDAGLSWKQILFINDSTGISDVVIHPQNDRIIYAAGWNRIRNNKISVVSGPDTKIYKSVDGGDTWKILTRGLPQGESSRIGIDICISDPNVLYASFTHPTSYNLLGIFKSIDGGESWNLLPLGEAVGLPPSVYAGFGWYFGKIRVNPTNPDDVFLLGVDLHRTKNGGISWSTATPTWSTFEVHADKHDLIFAGNKIYLTTDGGAYASDLENLKWLDLENIPATQFYRVAYNPTKPEIYYGGAQDNGTSGGNFTYINDWPRIAGGDGFQPVFHPSNSSIFYTETQNGGLSVTINGGLSFKSATTGITGSDPRNWDMPFMMSHHNPDVLYTGTNKIYVNESGANVKWKPISPDITNPESDFLRHNISSVHESPLNPDYLLAGTSDGLIWLSKNRGVNWENISLTLPIKYVSSVVFSPNEENTIYVSYTGYKDNNNTPYIYRSQNIGQTWQPIQGNMPLVAINNILILPASGTDRHIVVATDAGVYYTDNKGSDWKRMGNNLPIVTVYDIDYNVKKNQIIAGTFGRSIHTFDLNQVGYSGLVKTANIIVDDNAIMINNVINSDCRTLQIHKKIEQPLYYQITTTNGQQIIHGILYLKESEINVETLKPGIYFLSTYTKNSSKIQNSKKFVII